MRYITFVLSGILFIACSKGNSDKAPMFNESFQIHFDLGGKNYSLVFPKNEINPGYSYSGRTNTDHYFGDGAILNLPSSMQFTLILGSAKGDGKINWEAAYDSFKLLMSPGVKIYDSLQQCLQLNSNRVEIMLLDENKDIWGSTKWAISNGRVVQKSVDQPGGNFIITESKETSTTGNKNNAVIINGTFNCILYKADSQEKRNLTNGRFTLLIATTGN